ncbi:MAG: fibronectin type III domain-containing protein [Desulfuromonadales bacterium]|nr:fibronectin type III domain-containing protein [Desulfuromonadales bacterium]
MTTPHYFIISVPGAPTIGTATVGDTQATVTFTTPDSNGGSAITNYSVTSNPGNFTATGTGSPLTVTGLTNGTAYTFTVTATNAVGTGLQSISSNSVTPIGTQSITFPSLTAKSYGVGDFDPGATASSGLAVTYTSSNPAVATMLAGKIHVVGVGSTTITASQAGNTSFTAATDVTQSLTVNPATLTVTASYKSKTYGASNPALTIAYSGFVNSDTAASLTTQPVVATTATMSSAVGSYPITVSGGVSSNYTFTCIPGTLSVTQATLTVTANGTSRIYGVANPAFTLSYSGFVNGDTAASLTSQPTATTTATTASSAGSYPITVSSGASSNYSFTYVSGTLTVNTINLTVTANNASRSYGTANPAFTLSYSGFVNGDTAASLTSQPTAATAATSSSPVGSYPITVSGGASSNYSFTYVSGTLTVNTINLAVTANNASRSYGTANPAFTLSYSGFVNGDTAASLTSQPTATTTATMSSQIGSYPITVSGGVSGNYSFTYVSGALTVNTKNLTVTANNASRSYGTANPAFTLSYSGFVNGDTAASLTSQPTATTTATMSSQIGSYSITVSGGVSGNYSFSYVSGTLSINSGGEGGGTQVPVMDGWWLLPGMLAGLGMFARRRKE